MAGPGLALLITACLLIGCASPGPPAPLRSTLERWTGNCRAWKPAAWSARCSSCRVIEDPAERGYGQMAPDDPRPVTRDAVMPLASLTKPFTASAVLALAAEGRLGLDDAIGDLPA
jgi:CubicO group peptidase (beta-lactamase class C family)